MNQDPVMPTSDERLLGAIAYFLGSMGAVVVWILQREKSRFVRFHAVQALAFDFLMVLLGFVIFLCGLGVIFVGFFGSIFTVANAASSPETFPFLVLFPAFMPFGIFACVFPYVLILTVIRMIATVFVLSGRDFRFPWLGKQVEKFLGD